MLSGKPRAEATLSNSARAIARFFSTLVAMLILLCHFLILLSCPCCLADILVPFGKVTVEKDRFTIKEAELKKHLKSELEKIEAKKEKKTKDISAKKKNVITKEELYNDNQLKEGVDILRALIITQKNR